MTPPSPSTAERPSVLVVGAGAIGGLLAARLALAGAATVHLAARTPVDTLVLEDEDGVRATGVAVLSDPGDVPAVAWVVVATKAYDTAGAAPWLTAAGDEAPVVVAQNGIEHAERLAPVVDPARVVPMIVKHGAERPRPGHVVQTLRGDLKLPRTPHAERFAALANEAGLEARVVDDFADALWLKLAYNLVGNSLTTITDLVVREIGLRPSLRAQARLMVAECGRIARGHGARLPDDLADTMLAEFAAYPPTVRSSMWQDLRGGRPFEHDAISGAVVRAAEAAGTDAPYARMATHLLASLSPPTTDRS